MTLEEKVKKVIEELRLYIMRDGGDIEMVGVEGKRVIVRLKGACVGCPSAQLTLKNGVERTIKEKVPEIEEVISV